MQRSRRQIRINVIRRLLINRSERYSDSRVMAGCVTKMLPTLAACGSTLLTGNRCAFWDICRLALLEVFRNCD